MLHSYYELHSKKNIPFFLPEITNFEFNQLQTKKLHSYPSSDKYITRIHSLTNEFSLKEINIFYYTISLLQFHIIYLRLTCFHEKYRYCAII